MTQPTALFLADILESRNGNPFGFGLGPVCDKAATELRLLVAQRDALLEAMRLIAGLITNETARKKALDAIAKVEDSTP